MGSLVVMKRDVEMKIMQEPRYWSVHLIFVILENKRPSEFFFHD